MVKSTRLPIAQEGFQPIKVVGDCHEWQGSRNNFGYGQLSMDGWVVYAHRLAYAMAYGRVPLGLEVMHRCDNPPCVRPDHLFAGTHADNMADMRAKGRHHVPPERQARGSRQGSSKLTEADVLEIRAAAAAGVAQDELANQYGVHYATIRRAVARQTWRHV